MSVTVGGGPPARSIRSGTRAPARARAGRSSGGSAPTTAGASPPTRSRCASTASTTSRWWRPRCGCRAATPIQRVYGVAGRGQPDRGRVRERVAGAVRRRVRGAGRRAVSLDGRHAHVSTTPFAHDHRAGAVAVGQDAWRRRSRCRSRPARPRPARSRRRATGRPARGRVAPSRRAPHDPAHGADVREARAGLRLRARCPTPTTAARGWATLLDRAMRVELPTRALERPACARRGPRCCSGAGAQARCSVVLRARGLGLRRRGRGGVAALEPARSPRASEPRPRAGTWADARRRRRRRLPGCGTPDPGRRPS